MIQLLDLRLLFEPPASYFIMGALGGLLYILRQHLKGYRVRAVEYVARPVFGAVSAAILTMALALPNHFNSLFVGYFGIDAWDAIASRIEGKLPFATKHEKKETPPPFEVLRGRP